MANRKYKKTHIAFAVWIVIFKILVITSLVYIAFTLVEIRNDLQLTRDTQGQIEEQIDLNQQSMQSQINEISSSLLTTKKSLTEELSEIKASTSADFSGVIQDVIPGVVSIGTDVSQGSGFVISDDGYIVTNAHVLSGGTYARALLYESDEWVSVEPIGYDATLDIAILKFSGSGFNYLEFGDSEDIQVGEKAIAIGNPLGLSFSVSEGIVSALGREGPNGLPAYVQIDTPLNPGNSGGPLVNKKGEVIGINNFKIQGSENLGFALESNYAVDVINEILEVNNQTLRI
jgi:S1-C subfamily serine protease